MSDATDMKRRTFLTAAVGVSAAALYSAAARAEMCIDPEELASADYQFRKYVKYTESSPDPTKTCGACRYFKRPSQGDCGSCQVVASSINVNGHCDSWEAAPTTQGAK